MADKDIRRTTAKGLAPGTAPAKGRPNSQGKDYEGTPLSMTGIRGGLLHSTAMKLVLGLLIVIFAVSFLFTSSRLPTSGPNGGGPVSSGPDTVASVGGDNITRAKLNQMFGQQVQQAQMFGQRPGPMELLGLKQQALQALEENAAQSQAAAAAGITASDADIDKEIQKQIDDRIKGEKTSDEAGFRRQLEAKYPNGETGYRADLVKDYDRDAVRQYVTLQKYQDSIKASVKTTEDDYKASVTKLQLREIVLRAKLPSPTEKDFKAAQTKNAAEAQKRADVLVAGFKGKSGPALSQAFIALAKTQSDDATTKAKGGDLGLKLPSELAVGKNIQDALSAAKTPLVGPLQDDITKDSTIFLIENRKVELPKDYATKKAKYLKDFQDQKGIEAWSKKQDEIRKAMQPQVYDPALAAYQIQMKDIFSAPPAQQPAMRADALAKYQEGLGYALPAEQAAIRVQMAQLYRASNEPDKALDALQQATKGSDVPAIHLEYARALREAKKPKEAREQLKAASDGLTNTPSQPSMFGGNPDDAIRGQIASEYDSLGDKAQSAAERKKIVPAQGGGMGGMGGLPPGVKIMPSH